MSRKQRSRAVADGGMPAQDRSVIGRHLDRATGYLYQLIIGSWLGRIFTSYRTVNDGLYRRRNRFDQACRPASPRRRRLVETLERSGVLRGVGALFHYLFTCPVNFYGLFGLFYGLLGVALYFVGPMLDPTVSFATSRLVTCIVLAVLSIPPAVSTKPLSHVLGSGGLTRLILVKLLGVPRDRLLRTERQSVGVLPYVAILLAMGGTVATWWIHPLVIPMALLALGLLGLIFTYPEAGVVLAVATLPLLWINESFFALLVGLILCTWMGYGIKLLFMHRTVRLDVLGVAVLIFALLLLLSGMVGVVVTGETVVQGILLFIIMSLYFLVTNLMNTRAYVLRCIGILMASAVFVAVLGFLRTLPPDGLDWLKGSPAGDAIVGGLSTAFDFLTGLWAERSLSFLVLLLPLWYARLPVGRRVIDHVWILAVTAFGASLLVMADSLAEMVCALAACLLFFLLYSHKALTVCLVGLPLAGCGLAWYSYLESVRFAEIGNALFAGSGAYRTSLWRGVWRMICDHPAGVGLGSSAFTRVYPSYAEPLTATATAAGNMYFEIILSLGWHGLAVFVLAVLLFLQKCMSCVRYTGNRHDRAVLLGCVASVVGMLFLGVSRDLGSMTQVFLTFWLVMALASAYANVVFDECDVLMACTEGGNDRQDRVFRVGL